MFSRKFKIALVKETIAVCKKKLYCMKINAIYYYKAKLIF